MNFFLSHEFSFREIGKNTEIRKTLFPEFPEFVSRETARVSARVVHYPVFIAE